jgi:hypothetical protein
MTNDYARKFWLVLPAVCLALVLSQAESRAAFTVSINGTVVATDNGTGDSNSEVGIITYVNELLGYDFRIATTTNWSNPDVGDITSSELRVMNLSGTQNLTIAIQEQFDRPVFTGASVLTQSFTRNLSSTAGTSGSVSLTTTATSATGGGTGSAPTITFTDLVDADLNTGSFNRTSALYTLTQTITISGMNVSDGVLLTANSNVTNPSQAPLPVPAPRTAVLLLTALPLLGLCRNRLLKKKSAA